MFPFPHLPTASVFMTGACTVNFSLCDSSNKNQQGPYCILLSIYVYETSFTLSQFDFLCNLLHGAVMYNGMNADRIYDACKLLKEVEKITCDTHGLGDLNQYVNDDGDAAMNRDFVWKVSYCYAYECSSDYFCISW